jgi:hypothetical protein
VEDLVTRFQIILALSFFSDWQPPSWNCVVVKCTSGDMSTSGLAAAILDLSLPVRSASIVGITVGLLDPGNIGLAVRIALLSCVQQEFSQYEVAYYVY